MPLWKREVILNATIEYNYEALRSFGGPIRERGRVGDRQVSELVEDVTEIINHRLPTDLANIFGIHAKTRIVATRYGSVTLFFGVLLSTFSFIASYRDFFDSIQLIREHAGMLLRGLVNEQYSGNLDVNVSVVQPRLEDPRERHLPRLFRHFPPDIVEDLVRQGYFAGVPGVRRDAFFWFLLLLTFLLLGVVGLLVYGAVVNTYFS